MLHFVLDMRVWAPSTSCAFLDPGLACTRRFPVGELRRSRHVPLTWLASAGTGVL